MSCHLFFLRLKLIEEHPSLEIMGIYNKANSRCQPATEIRYFNRSLGCGLWRHSVICFLDICNNKCSPKPCVADKCKIIQPHNRQTTALEVVLVPSTSSLSFEMSRTALHACVSPLPVLMHSLSPCLLQTLRPCCAIPCTGCRQKKPQTRQLNLLVRGHRRR